MFRISCRLSMCRCECVKKPREHRAFDRAVVINYVFESVELYEDNGGNCEARSEKKEAWKASTNVSNLVHVTCGMHHLCVFIRIIYER